jgi:hypothetical protein
MVLNSQLYLSITEAAYVCSKLHGDDCCMRSKGTNCVPTVAAAAAASPDLPGWPLPRRDSTRASEPPDAAAAAAAAPAADRLAGDDGPPSRPAAAAAAAADGGPAAGCAEGVAALLPKSNRLLTAGCCCCWPAAVGVGCPRPSKSCRKAILASNDALAEV